MNVFGKIWCRLYQGILRVAMVFAPWHSPKVIEGANTFGGAVEVLCSNGVTRPLVVCDKATIERHALDGFFQNACGKLTVTVYDGVLPNPTVSQVEVGVTLYLQQQCNGILAFGGGSALDCAKAIGARIVRPKKTVNQLKGLMKVRKKLPPFFAVPTTAGTGSECTVAAVITDSETHDKYAINDFNLIPHYAVLDPMLTVGLPQHLTATTGMDALTHAVEAYIGRSNTRFTKRAAEEAVKLIVDNLPIAVSNGQDLAARQNMQKAAYLAGQAFTRAYVGYVHALAHSLGGKYGVAHGLANAVLLPVVLRKYGRSAHKKLAKLSILCNIVPPNADRATAANAFICAIEDMNAQMGIPTCIPEIRTDDVPELAKHAAREANPLYPVPKLWTVREFATAYRAVQDTSHAE